MSMNLVERKRDQVSTGFEFRPQNLAEAMKYAELMAASDLVPKEYKGKPSNVLVAIQMGGEVGLHPMQSMQSISVINGKPTIWGDAALALVVVHQSYEWHKEEIIADPDGGNHRAYCTVKRKGNEPHTSEFSVEDAKKAGLWNKGGTWSSYPKVMLKMRARGFALRDKFPDALKGLHIREEVLDYEEFQEDGKSVARHKDEYKGNSDMLADMIGGATVIDAEMPEVLSQEDDILAERLVE